MEKTIKIETPLHDVLFYTDITYAHRQNFFKQYVKPMAVHIMRPIYDIEHWETLPLLIWVGGGAWKGSTPFRAIPMLSYFARRGYVVASVDYTVSGEDIFPAQIRDVKAAIRFLRAHAAQYGIDPNRVALIGDSAGGHLVSLAALSTGVEEFKTDDWAGLSDEVQAVVDLYGPSVFPVSDEQEITGECWQSPDSLLLGGHCSARPELAKLASPITHVKKDAPPFMILHGTNDTMVGIRHSEALYHALCEAGAKAEFYRIEGAGHATPEFAQDETLQMILNFLNAHLI